MPGISRQTVAKVAELARLDLEDRELDEFAGELDVIVKAVADVSQAPVDDLVPTSHPMKLSNVFREDVVKGQLSNEQALASAPDAEDGQFKVPAILDGE